jgi:hypothetical protein
LVGTITTGQTIVEVPFGHRKNFVLVACLSKPEDLQKAVDTFFHNAYWKTGSHHIKNWPFLVNDPVNIVIKCTDETTIPGGS